MKQPMTTSEAINTYGPEAESDTCSFRCPKCNTRIWFKGDITDIDTPHTCTCPGCKEEVETFNGYQSRKQ